MDCSLTGKLFCVVCPAALINAALIWDRLPEGLVGASKSLLGSRARGDGGAANRSAGVGGTAGLADTEIGACDCGVAAFVF